MADWPFSEPPNLGVFTTRQLLSEGYPLRLVTHDEGGDWLADLPIGWRAWREDGSGRGNVGRLATNPFENGRLRPFSND